ncbi:uncharacterized protein N7503_001034 [Penicillium pulvis]|uniref:uncharacterized protein n=1 Tax=Penicillium pulvis TaxID=1562058 RepID=UPI002546F30F|nr:uncharacterized protein N7503_001034 [Penicillium pulvis]KAJ5814284.1 hypothetical protein N7503_001034 [Penicillium pulvis]
MPMQMILGHERTLSGIRPSADKIHAILTWPRPECEADLMRFIYVLPYMKVYIPGRSDMVAILKECVNATGKGKQRRVISFDWTSKQQKVFDRIKKFFSKIQLVNRRTARPRRQQHEQFRGRDRVDAEAGPSLIDHFVDPKLIPEKRYVRFDDFHGLDSLPTKFVICVGEVGET